MKTMMVLMLFALGWQDTYSQAKQRKELLLQIAALQVYIDYAQKGYKVVKKGVNLIGDLKQGEVRLHSDYFTSLKKVNPKVKHYARVAEIIAMQVKIIKVSQKTVKQIRRHDLFHGSEMDYIERSFDRLTDNCSKTLDLLLVLTTDGKMEIKDDQRLERIDGLYREMCDNYLFCQNFTKEIKGLAVSKKKEQYDIKTTGSLYGIK